MQSNRGRDTGPELRLRREVHARGMRYFVNKRPISEFPRTADLVFPRERIAVFVDGCFWHGCHQHHNAAATNAAYWAEKLATNRMRDVDTDRRLREAGWLPVRIWEHVGIEEAADLVQETVRQRRKPRKESPVVRNRLDAYGPRNEIPRRGPITQEFHDYRCGA